MCVCVFAKNSSILIRLRKSCVDDDKVNESSQVEVEVLDKDNSKEKKVAKRRNNIFSFI